MVENLKLKSLRALHGISSIEMAKILRKNKGTYCMKENGSREFTRKEIEDIYYYFQMNPEQLVDVFFDRKVHTKRIKARK